MENKTSSDAKLRAVGSAALRGDGEYESNLAQARLSKEALNQIMSIGVLAWKSLSPSDGKLSTLSNIKQGTDEKYEDFMARLKTAVERTIKSTEPAEIVLKQLAYENANSTFQALLRPVRSKGSLWTYIHTDQPGSRNFLYAGGVALAAALRGEMAAQVIQGMRKKVNPSWKRFYK